MPKKLTQEEFIARAQEKHKNEDGSPKYGYDKVKYVTNKKNVTITCLVEGHPCFEQSPKSHLNGGGCPKCAIISRSNKQRKPIEQFIEQAQEKHKNQDGSPKYGYNDFIYLGTDIKGKIFCFVEGHKYFEQTPNSHLSGSGCPKCSRKTYSKSCINLFSTLFKDFNIQHAENEGEKKLIKKYKADGYYKASNQEEIDDIFKICEDYYTYRNYDSLEVVIEYHGCFWHGCKECFPDRQELNDVNNCTYEELYNKTEKRKEELIEAGYNYIEIWEHEV